jgi:hypothetical protein
MWTSTGFFTIRIQGHLSNPFKDQLDHSIFLSGNGTTRVAVYNLLGQEIDAITKN